MTTGLSDDSMDKPLRPWLLSFSGVDGAGKSTQIANLRSRLEQAGMRVRVITFWDDVVMFPRLRDGLSTAVFRGEKGIGTPQRPVHRRDKNVTAGYAILVRYVLYLFDALHLAALVARLGEHHDVIIFDRFIYDELANLPLADRIAARYIGWVLRWAPRPDIAFFLDADPEQACARKPEYPLDFVRRNRTAYLAISRLVSSAAVIPPLPLAEACQEVANTALHRLRHPRPSALEPAGLEHPAVG
jgi:thymidylate kinase